MHPSDADKAPPGVRMGWHDAGDLSLYSASLNTALFWLLDAFSDFRPTADDSNIPESGNGVPDLLDEARWGLEWLLSVQDASGGFRNTTCVEHYGSYGTNTPNNVPPYQNGEVGTLATARAVGNLAYASSIYRAYDAAFADRCLQAASNGYRYLKAHWSENSDGPTCPAYRADANLEVGRHARMFAAAGMLLAAGSSRQALTLYEPLLVKAAPIDPQWLRVAHSKGCLPPSSRAQAARTRSRSRSSRLRAGSPSGARR